jgi:hypothetical protein
MKKLLAGKFALAIAGLFALGQAHAVPSQVVTYVYYNGTVPIGQSIRGCDSAAEHWGTATLATQSQAVAVAYSCATRTAIRVTFPTSIDPWVQANFCNTTGICELGPQEIQGGGVLVPGMFSD